MMRTSRKPARRLLVLELNEVNFGMLGRYIDRGHLPAFAAFFARHGYTTTTSEAKYNDLEPWIQWVTAHTGMTLAEHGVFRLGDIVDTDHPQIWEQLAAKGFSVGAISPMNAKLRLHDPAFFIPDPWTPTGVVASATIKRMSRAIAQAVNDNATASLTLVSSVGLAVGGALTARPRNYPTYVRYVAQARSRPWFRSLFLDRLLADLFVQQVSRTGVEFATLFLNAAAHIQHRYMFNSPFYNGALRNPAWYVAANEDPLLDAYRLYDDILGEIVARFPDARIMLMTGLHQDPHPEVTFYWRLRDHSAFLRDIGAGFVAVEPKMSRDFLIRCASPAEARATQARLEAATLDGQPLFTVDNRCDSLFVMLSFADDIAPGAAAIAGNHRIDRFRDRVAFVAIKNGAHNGIGYFADSGAPAGDAFELRTMPDRIMAAMVA